MNIKVSNYTYIFLLISFLSGYFEYVFLFLFVIIIHECGHVIFSKLVSFKFKEVIIYPFGGLTIYDEELNTRIYKEFITLIGGLIFQILLYYLIIRLYNNNLVTFHTFNIITKIHYTLLSFNFLPILPLDGGRLINLIFNYIFSYKLSIIFSIVISIIFIIIFLIFNKTILSIILSLFLIKCIILEIMNIELKTYKFILERYLNNYNFKKIKCIKKLNQLKRDYYHIIDNIDEKKYLNKLFDINT